MNGYIKRFDVAEEFDTPERCFITEMVNHVDEPELSIARARVAPGVTTAWHKLIDTAERYLILSGHGLVELEGLEPTEVSAGDVVVIPPDTPQRITNLGDDDLIFFAVCTPRFSPECYVELIGSL